MLKSIFHIFTFLLVPCLLADPTLAAAVSHQQSIVKQTVNDYPIPTKTSLFYEQSLTAPDAGARFSKPLGILATVAVITAITTVIFAHSGHVQMIVGDKERVHIALNAITGLAFVLGGFFDFEKNKDEAGPWSLEDTEGHQSLPTADNDESFSIDIPGTSEKTTIYVDKRLTKLLRSLPIGVRVTIFGSQALQMLHPKHRGQLLADSDIDLHVSDPLAAESVQTYLSKLGYEIDLRNKPENFGARYTVNRLGLVFESLGADSLKVSFRKTTNAESVRDALAGVLRITANTNFDWASAVRGLLYRYRFGFQIEPDTLESIRDMLRASALVTQDDYGALRKLFKYLGNPVDALLFLLNEVPLAEFNEAALETILRQLLDMGQLTHLLSSTQLTDDVREALKARPEIRWRIIIVAFLGLTMLTLFSKHVEAALIAPFSLIQFIEKTRVTALSGKLLWREMDSAA